jgi:hypothetical protein
MHPAQPRVGHSAIDSARPRTRGFTILATVQMLRLLQQPTFRDVSKRRIQLDQWSRPSPRTRTLS